MSQQATVEPIDSLFSAEFGGGRYCLKLSHKE
jgi:hypothetical protein